MDKQTVTGMSELAWAMFPSQLHEENCRDSCPICYFCPSHHTVGCHGTFFDWFTEGEDVEIDYNARPTITLEELFGGEDNDD